jgi:predicted RNA methylase
METSIPDFTPDQLIPISHLPSVSRDTRVKRLFLESVMKEVPTKGIVMDIGCGNGELGALIAHEKESKLIQLDTVDRRDKDFKFTYLPLSHPTEPSIPDKLNGAVDLILLSDVLQHIKGFDTSSLDQSIATYLKRLLPFLSKDGKLIINFTHNSADRIRANESVWSTIESNQDLKSKVLLSFRPKTNKHIVLG